MVSGIDGKVVAITGASSGGGICDATAHWLAARGAKVVLGARRTDKLALIAKDIAHHGDAVRWRQLDVTQASDVKAFIDEAYDWHGKIDVLINNAGVMPLLPFNTAGPVERGGKQFRSCRTRNDAMREFRRIAIDADAIARAISYAIEQPDDADVSEIIVRPTASPY